MSMIVERIKALLICLGDITIDLWREITYAIKINLRYVTMLMRFGGNYLMAYLAILYGINYGLLLIPVCVTLLCFYMDGIANKIGANPNEIPVPAKRFTEVSEDGEVTIVHSRLQEMLVYMADLEDYLERKGKLK